MGKSPAMRLIVLIWLLLPGLVCSEVPLASNSVTLSNQSETLAPTLRSVVGPKKETEAEDAVESSALSGAAMNFGSSLTIITHAKIGENVQFCRFRGACRVGNGTVHLPAWMKKHSETVQKCGIADVTYSLSSTTNGSLTFSNKTGSQEAVSLKREYIQFDVIGNYAPLAERSLLAHDITARILLLDLFRRADAYNRVTKTDYVFESEKPGRDEDQSDLSAVKPLVLVDSRISDTKDFKWPKSVLRLLRNSVGGMLEVVDLKDLYGWRVKSEASCFSSIVSTNAKIEDITPDALIGSNSFFVKNGINRRPLVSTRKAGANCTTKVLILNRYGKRYIEGADVLSAAIRSLGLQLQKDDHKIVVESEVVFFENSSFHEQVSVMQESNIVVASHGDGNANFLFLRPEARVFELMPFGFLSDIYAKLSRAYGVMHSTIRAQPDADVFLSCVKHFNSQDSKERSEFIDEWTSIAQAYRDETLHKNANVKSDYEIRDDGEPPGQSLRMLRQCASYQRISVDTRHLAKAVVKSAAEQCRVKGNGTFLKDL